MGHHHHHHTHSDSIKNLSIAFFLNLAFTIIEIFGGLYTNSLAIVSDAVHDLGDSVSLGLAWYFQRLSKRKNSKTYTYGYKRFTVLGAVINTIVLIVGSIYIISEAIPRIIHPEETHVLGMMWLAILGILVNGAAVFKLKRGKSLNERVVSLHLLEDVLGWVAVLLTSIIMQFWELPVLDPLLSVVIALYVLYNAFKNGKESVAILLHAVPKNLSLDHLNASLISISGVEAIQHLHIWSLDGHENVCSLSLKINHSRPAEEIRKEIKTMLHDDYHCEFTTISLISGDASH